MASKATKIILGAAVGIVPLFVANGLLYSYTTPKSLLIILLSIALMAIAIFNFSHKKDLKIKYSRSYLFFSIFLLALILSALLGYSPQLSFFGSFLDGRGINLIFALFIFSIAISREVRQDQKFAQTLISFSIICASIVSIGTFFAERFPGTLGGSTLGNTSYAGAYLMLNFFLAIYLAYKDRGKRTWWALCASLILFSPVFINWQGPLSLKNPFGLLGSANGAQLGLLSGSIVFGILILIKNKRKKLRLWGYITLGLCIGLATFLAIGFSNTDSRIHHLFFANKSSNRTLFTQIAFEAFKDRPLTGYGINNYNQAFRKYSTNQFFAPGYQYEPHTYSSHNILWDYLCEGGVVVFISFLAFIFYLISLLWKKIDRENKIYYITLISLLVAYFVQGLFIFDSPAVLVVLFLVFGLIFSQDEYRVREIVFKKANYKKAAIIIALILMIYLVIVCFLKPWKEAREWKKYNFAPNILKNLNSTQKISLLGSLDDEAYIFSEVNKIIFSSIHRLNIPKREISIKVLSKISNELNQSTYSDPNPYRAYVTLSDIYTTLYLLTSEKKYLFDSLNNLESALKINSFDPYISLKKAESLYFLKMNDLSIEAINEASRLAHGNENIEKLIKELKNKIESK